MNKVFKENFEKVAINAKTLSSAFNLAKKKAKDAYKLNDIQKGNHYAQKALNFIEGKNTRALKTTWSKDSISKTKKGIGINYGI